VNHIYKQIGAIFLLACLAVDALAARANHVFIVSFDGGKPSVMRDSVMPMFKQMQQQGACTSTAFTVVPSYTLIAHTSMLTGVQPNKHLIDWNYWWPDRGPVRVPTIFALARAKGLTTGLIAGKTKFQHLYLPGSLDLFSAEETSALDAAKIAAKFIVTKKPNLTFIHFADADSIGHSYGWGSEEQKQAFAGEDIALQILRNAVIEAGIEKDSVFLLTADHGGQSYGHGTTDLEDMHIPWVAWGKDVKPGVLTRRIDIHDTAATALWLLGVSVPRHMDGRPVREAFYSR
jgi:predicted AlkP superfamily pyrophosphatase or phosphodiesterase